MNLTFKRIFKYGFRKIWWISNYRKYNKLGKGTYIFAPLKITPKTILCGENVKIWKNARIEGVTKYNSTIYYPLIIINDNVSIQQNIHLTCAQSIIIGKNTALAANVTITDIHHPYNDITIPIESQDIQVNPVIIGEDCKIYNNVVILPGSVIGKHCTIGANSVVSGKYPDFCVIAGTPAKIVKRYNFKTESWEKTNPDGTFIK